MEGGSTRRRRVHTKKLHAGVREGSLYKKKLKKLHAGVREGSLYKKKLNSEVPQGKKKREKKEEMGVFSLQSPLGRLSSLAFTKRTSR
jgi:exopolyphosphatase/pppGpp-phosphohydrolase